MRAFEEQAQFHSIALPGSGELRGIAGYEGSWVTTLSTKLEGRRCWEVWRRTGWELWRY